MAIQNKKKCVSPVIGFIYSFIHLGYGLGILLGLIGKDPDQWRIYFIVLEVILLIVFFVYIPFCIEAWKINKMIRTEREKSHPKI